MSSGSSVNIKVGPASPTKIKGLVAGTNAHPSVRPYTRATGHGGVRDIGIPRQTLITNV